MGFRPILLFSLFFFTACSGVNSFRTEQDAKTGERRLIVFRSGNSAPILEIPFTGGDEQVIRLKIFIDQVLLRISPYTDFKGFPLLSAPFPFESSYYSLYYRIGSHFLAGWRNELIKYGILEMEWRNLKYELLDNQTFRNEAMRSGFERIFRIKDLDNVLFRYRLDRRDSRQVYPYIVNYLLKEVYFVSIQEFYSREERYFNLNELENIFTRIVILPEAREFTAYLLEKYGKAVVIKLAGLDFNNENWEKALGEKISDTEGDFAKKMENYPFSGVFKNEFFINDLNKYLKLYNKTTKQTLFKK